MFIDLAMVRGGWWIAFVFGLSLVLCFACWLKYGKPAWRWGNKKGGKTMRPAEVQPVLDELFLGLGKRFAQIRFESMFVVSTFAAAHQEMTQLASLTKQRQPNAATGHRFRNMWAAMPAMDVRQWPPISIAIGGRQAQDEEFIFMLIENLNGQLLWLLVQAFEAIEKYYKDFYGALGYLDNNLLQCSDFGNVRIPELADLSLVRYQEQVRRIIGRHNVDDILNNLRRVFPAFAKAETNHIDLKLWFDAAAFFRHMIVHERACIPKAELLPRLAKATGHSFTGHTQEVKKRFFLMVSHFELQSDTYSLLLIDRNCLRSPYTGLNDRFDRLLNKLSSHAALTYATAMEHFGQQPFWERQEDAPTTRSNATTCNCLPMPVPPGWTPTACSITCNPELQLGGGK